MGLGTDASITISCHRSVRRGMGLLKNDVGSCRLPSQKSLEIVFERRQTTNSPELRTYTKVVPFKDKSFFRIVVF
jgi:hypothetical protein